MLFKPNTRAHEVAHSEYIPTLSVDPSIINNIKYMNALEPNSLPNGYFKYFFKKGNGTDSSVRASQLKNAFGLTSDEPLTPEMFDYMLDNVDKKLTKEIIIEMNKILKRNTSDEDNPRYNVGGFKVVPNIIGVVNIIDTTAPEEVEEAIETLLNEYNSKSNVTLENIIDFHYKFEKIHPFGDGNGRVGRIIMFKECLKNNIMPFIVLDEDKTYYMRGLKEYEHDKMFLIDTIKHEQDLYESVCEKLLDFEID